MKKRTLIKKILPMAFVIPLTISLVNPNPTYGKTAEEKITNQTEYEEYNNMAISFEDGSEYTYNSVTNQWTHNGEVIDEETLYSLITSSVQSDLISPFNIDPGGGSGTLLEYNEGVIGVSGLRASTIMATILTALGRSGAGSAAAIAADTLVEHYSYLNFAYYTEFVWQIPDPNWPNLFTRKLHDVVFYSDVNRKNRLFSVSFY